MFAILVFAMVTATYLFISAVCVTVCWLYVPGAVWGGVCVCVTVCAITPAANGNTGWFVRYQIGVHELVKTNEFVKTNELVKTEC